MRRRYLFFFSLVGIAGFLFLLTGILLLFQPLKAGPITFSGTPAGEEYAWNRDGSIVKISDRLAVMKLNGEADELIFVTDPESTDFRWTVLDKGEFVRWNLEKDRLVLTVSENGEEREKVFFIADLVPADQ